MDSKTAAELTANVTAQALKQLTEERKAQHLQKCHKYALFFQNTSASNANAIFWGLFLFDIILLVIASLLWASQDKHSNNFEKAALDEENLHDLSVLEKKKRRSHERVVLASILCFLLAIPSVIVESFAGMAITFCHKEDVPFLYWGVFFLLSVGSLIAIMGLSFGIIFSHRRPPWNLNLGTPVLVIAGLVHLAWDGMRDLFRKLRGLEPKVAKGRDSMISMTKSISHAHSGGSVVGLLPIWKTLMPGAPMPDGAILVGTFSDTGVRLVVMAPDPEQPSSAGSNVSTSNVGLRLESSDVSLK